MQHHDAVAWRRLMLQAVVVLACTAARADAFAVKTDDNYECPLDETQLASPRSEVFAGVHTVRVCLAGNAVRVRCALCLCVCIRARASVYENLLVRWAFSRAVRESRTRASSGEPVPLHALSRPPSHCTCWAGWEAQDIRAEGQVRKRFRCGDGKVGNHHLGQPSNDPGAEAVQHLWLEQGDRCRQEDASGLGVRGMLLSVP